MALARIKSIKAAKAAIKVHQSYTSDPILGEAAAWAADLASSAVGRGILNPGRENSLDGVATLAGLELRHRRRARCEDRIRCAKDTGLRNLPLHGYAQNRIWCEIVALACDLLAWMAMLALPGPARRWEPKRLRLRLFTGAARIVRGGRRIRLRISATSPWAPGITAAFSRLHALTPG